MAEGNCCAVLKRRNELCIERRRIPEPLPNEVLIAIHSVGICGSDIHFWKNGRIGDMVLTDPIVVGHEASGIIVKVGENVTNLKKGDKVCIEPGDHCKRCQFCKSGKYNLCPKSVAADVGYIRQYLCHDADLCFKLPDNVSLEEAALMEPLAVAVHACRRAGVTPGQSVLICGAGAIGLLNLLVCKAMGVYNICVTDISEARLHTAKSLGAKSKVCVKNIATDEMFKKIITYLDGSPDITFECSGAESSIRMGMKITKSGGVLMLVGLGAPEVTVPVIEATLREVNIKGVYRYVNCYPTALELVSSGAVNLKPLITHHFPMKDTVKAFETAQSGAGGAIKVLVHCSDRK